MNSVLDAFHCRIAETASLKRQDQVAALRNELKTLDEAIKQLQHAQQICLSMIPPIHRLPLEILGRIFTFIIPPYPMDRLLDICLVCQRWRQAANATHGLWTTLAVRFEEHIFDQDKAELWWKKAGALPKTLMLRAFTGEYCDSDSCELDDLALAKFLTSGPILSRLMIQVCTSLRCVGRLIKLIQEAGKNFAGSRPWDAVEELELELVPGYPEDNVGALGNDVFAQLPPVTSFKLVFQPLFTDGVDYYDMFIPESILARLTKFTLVCGTAGNINDLLTVLEACQQVETLEVDLDYIVYDTKLAGRWKIPSEANIFTLSAMRTLRLRCVRKGGMQCLRFFRAPMLETLETAYGRDWNGVWAESDALAVGRYLCGLVDRSGCGNIMQRLQMRYMRIRTKTLENLLCKLPRLTELTLDDVEFDPALFRSLGTVKPPPLSCLHVLEIFYANGAFDEENARAYIQARRDLANEDGSPLANTALLQNYRKTRGESLWWA